MATDEKVHLDHHIKRQSIRYSPESLLPEKKSKSRSSSTTAQDNQIRISDIEGTWFERLRKPDFQRETNAWTPEECVSLLDSVIYGKIIPSIILWKNEETSSVFVLDGAHRLSVLRAWMLDDWGMDSEEYYKRKSTKKVKEAAKEAKRMVSTKIGKKEEFEKAYERMSTLLDREKNPSEEMSTRKFDMARNYSDIYMGHRTLTAQWERGDYESAEESFLRINRRGETLDEWESMLIEYRNSSYARTIMSIASGGEEGHYWPPLEGEKKLSEKVKQFYERCKRTYERLFIPTFEAPIEDLTVPMMVAPKYFQKHKYLIEIIPLLNNRKISQTEESQKELLKRDVDYGKKEIIKNGDDLLSSIEDSLDHVESKENSSKSLSIVPLFYFYNHKGTFKRGLLYGFLYWLLSGKEEEISDRKRKFSSVRREFEYVLHEYKAEISDYERSIGAGLKSTKTMGSFFQNLVSLLISTNGDIDSDEFEDDFLEIMGRSSRNKRRSSKKSRTASRIDKSEKNIIKLFNSGIRCHICGGLLDLKSGGVQYDHVKDWSDGGKTSTENIEPTHPYCNRHKDKIMEIKDEGAERGLPVYLEKSASSGDYVHQTELFSEDDFPG